MAYFEDLGTQCQVASGPVVRAIGWLSAEHPFARGAVADDVIAKLSVLVRDGWIHVAAAGPHTCELCGNVRESRNVLVPASDVLFVAPAMIVHYVTDHAYQPPAAFLEAVGACALPPTDEYFAALFPFADVLSPDRRAPTLRGWERTVALHRQRLNEMRAAEAAEATKKRGIWW